MAVNSSSAALASVEARRAVADASLGCRRRAGVGPRARPARKHLAQSLRGMARVDLDDFLGRPLGDDPPALCAAVRPQVDDPVGRLDHVEIVLDHDDRVPQCGEAVKHIEQLANVVEMQARGRLVQDIQRLARPLLDQLASQLDPLRLAAGKRR